MTAVATDVLTTEEMITIAREQMDSFNTGDWERLQARLTADSRYHEFGTQRKVESPEEIVELFKGWKTAFPDAAAHRDERRWQPRHGGVGSDLEGHAHRAAETADGTIPASGKRQETPAAFVFAFEGGRIKESRHYFDSMTLLEQIGVQPK